MDSVRNKRVAALRESETTDLHHDVVGLMTASHDIARDRKPLAVLAEIPVRREAKMIRESEDERRRGRRENEPGWADCAVEARTTAAVGGKIDQYRIDNLKRRRTHMFCKQLPNRKKGNDQPVTRAMSGSEKMDELVAEGSRVLHD